MAKREETSVVLNRLATSIQSEDRRKKKVGLDELFKELFIENEIQNFESSESFNEVLKNLWKCLYDKSESVRDAALNIMDEFILKMEPNVKFLGDLIPIIVWRVGDKECNEPSEEIRLRYIILLHNVVLTYKTLCSSFVEDFVQILERTLVDSYPKVRQRSCICAGDLAATIPRHFYEHSNKLVKPIISSFGHQHFRMRVIAIEALGNVVRWGSTKHLKVEEVFSSLAQKLFDPTPAVRSAVIKVVGDWFINLHDRYSFFRKMMPLMLSGLSDELEELREEAWKLWDAAGLQFEQENEQELKDKMDFFNDKPEHYPENVIRPNLGCRTLVQRNTCQITPALSRELEDWKPEIRLKSSQLLCLLVLHNETDITQHAEPLLIPMCKVCNQVEEKVVENVEKAAEYLAYFVPPASYLPLILPWLEDQVTPGHLCVLASLLLGSRPDLLAMKLEEVVQVLCKDTISRTRVARQHVELLKCVDALLTVIPTHCSGVSAELFGILTAILAVTSQEPVANTARVLLSELATQSGFEDVTHLYREHAETLLVRMDGSVDSWSSVSHDRFILQLILTDAGDALSTHLPHIAAILKPAMTPDKDAATRAKLFAILGELLCERKSSLCSDNEAFHRFLKDFIVETICPNLVWSAGRTSEALRSLVLNTLCAAILPDSILSRDSESIPDSLLRMDTFDVSQSTLCHFDKSSLEHTVKTLFPLLLNSSDDAAVKTRHCAVLALLPVWSVGRCRDFYDPDDVNKLYPVLSKRLDDVSEGVRRISLLVLSQLYKMLPPQYNADCFQPHLEMLYSSLLVHLDDPDPEFQQIMFHTLQTVGQVSPKVLHDKLELTKNRFRNRELCEKLLIFLRECPSSSSK